MTLIAPIRPLQLCADGGYQLRLGVLGVPLIMVPDSNSLPFVLLVCNSPEWWMDSGANINVCADASMFSSWATCSSSVGVIYRKGELTKVHRSTSVGKNVHDLTYGAGSCEV